MRVRACALIREEGKILTLVYHYPNGDVYAIPGGNLEQGETLASCLVREYREELGLEIEVGPLLYVGDMQANEFIKQTVHVVFEGRIISGKPALNPEHTSAADVCWLDIQTDHAMLYPSINAALLEDDGKPFGRYLGDCMARQWA